ncbi:DDE-type integrase/transposase/recombinase, partial [Rivularia sp. UHCC 0363]|uniref:DDE-type integrase/transposase/recombinase n=1 Tax=Rivularia sp. UHCC 0363 TaxID=3110244 RepID=UPI002B214062
LCAVEHHAGSAQQRQIRLIEAAAQLAQTVGVAPACVGLGLCRATYYRHQSPPSPTLKPRRDSARKLTPSEVQRVLELLNSPRFMNQSPAEVYATLLDEGTYLCSIRTFYRILMRQGQLKERCNQLRHPEYKKPELLATGINQLWSWDITKLQSLSKWTYFHKEARRGKLPPADFCLYVILDVYSRYVVGWMVAHRESATLAQQLIEQTVQAQQIQPGHLTVHADRGASMTSKSVAFLLADLGVTKSHSRPHVSNDNPYSEAQFKTLKYQPQFPKQFGSIEDARAFCCEFFGWYNQVHHHSGIGLLTPAQLHSGQAERVPLRGGQPQAKRAAVLNQAYESHPERFVRGLPQPPAVPSEVWINPPKICQLTQEVQH